MHAPDGLLNVGTALATGGISVGCVALATRRCGAELQSRLIPLTGVTSAFLFAAQMLNFPVGVGVSGHILGAALAAILLGPYLGSLSSTVVVVVQALVFADGGITALGYNVLNLAVVPAFGGYALYVLFRRFFPANQVGVALSTGFAAAGSVILAATAFSIEWLFGATVPVPFDTVFGAMVSVHLLIGVGEGVVSGLVIAAILRSRQDIVFGAQDLPSLTGTGGGTEPKLATSVKWRTFIVCAAGLSVVMAAVFSQLAASTPDGFERVVADTGIEPTQETTLGGSLFADYATEGITNPSVSLAVAGIAGVLVVAVTGFGMLVTVRLVAGKPPVVS